MSIIAWDGTTIAADRNVSAGDLSFPGIKLIKVTRGFENYIIGWTGDIAKGHVLRQWFVAGEKVEAWPHEMQKDDKWCRLIVLAQHGLYIYEDLPVKIWLHPDNPFMAWGSGRDFALGAMGHGATAEEAVAIANRFCATCGHGVTSYAQAELEISKV